EGVDFFSEHQERSGFGERLLLAVELLLELLDALVFGRLLRRTSATSEAEHRCVLNLLSEALEIGLVQPLAPEQRAELLVPHGRSLHHDAVLLVGRPSFRTRRRAALRLLLHVA